ncbi:MAG TPA: glutaminyl-peptide cyclotransferase [Bryobacteraceae bacterium]|nr:glutaminyl-peptide cyclotransferase [Bryobacteraceae bacterium]
MRAFLAAVLAAVSLLAQAPISTVRVVHVYPHDPGAFTQGLEFRDGFLYEGTGLENRSTLRKVQLETGKVLREIHLAGQYFGEGITVLNGRIFELTWLTNKGFVYRQDSFARLSTFSYPGEGWGLANDGRQIYMSDGSAQIRVWDPATLREIRHIGVHDGAKPVERLNELEWVNGEIYANVWTTDRIARISPADGRVLGWIDCSGLLSAAERAQADVLNGIAYDAAGRRLFITGKLWPKLFQIELVSGTP